MSEFRRVQHAEISPTKCFTCGTHEGPFIDTGGESPAYGHVYICAATDRRSGCLHQMARLDGMVEIGDLQRAETLLDDSEQKIAELENALHKLAQQKVVSVADVVGFLNRTAGTSSTTVALRLPSD